MTGYGDDYPNDGDGKGSGSGDRAQLMEEREKKRLESVLKNAELTWKRGREQDGTAEKDGDTEDSAGGKRRKQNTTADNNNDDDDKTNNEEGGMLSLLSPELRAQFSGMNNDSLLILPSNKNNSKKKKSKQKASLPPLTPQEIKAAKALYKNTQRKLAQLESRRKQKELRNGLYKDLEENSLLAASSAVGGEGKSDDGAGNATGTNDTGSKRNSSVTSSTSINNKITSLEAQSLLLKSSQLGKKVTKREKLKQLRRKEALGIELTKEEMDVLYVKYDAPGEDSFPVTESGDFSQMKDAGDGEGELGGVGKKRKSKKNRKSRGTVSDNDAGGDGEESNKLEVKGNVEPSMKKAKVEVATSQDDATNASSAKKSQASSSKVSNNTTKETTTTASSEPTNYAQMMMAGLSSLKSTTDTRNAELEDEKEKQRQKDEEDAMRLEEEERNRRKVYVPSETVTVSTMHRRDAVVDKEGDASKSKSANDNSNKIQHIARPASIEESRYDLPVSAMEYEIIDAVRSNDCTILCGETGSGKSTQVPQFLYETGFSVNGSRNGNTDVGDDASTHLLIGVTQPRRVAAVSTAKRVCYEMGQGDGQTIKSAGNKGSNGNLVSYQTRYETAGLGKSTHIKFMTDGILLQEIQSDLLLRKYGAIVIDEAHERNLNTDVLLGLLSVALPLRRKAAEEGSLPPLKLVVMSATLKVEDFTENTRLFPKGEDGVARPPAVVKVPGRTHPVSIHHSKVTELDDYGKTIVTCFIDLFCFFTSTITQYNISALRESCN